MANVKFPRKEIEKEIKLTPETVEKINMMGIPVESIDSESIEIQVLPNRPDVISLQGFLRAIKAFTGKSPGLIKYKVNKPERDYKVEISPSVKDIRPFTACAIVKNLKFDNESIKEIIDMQEKLHTTLGRNRKKAAIGIYPLEKIKLPIKYEALSPEKIKFIPLDFDKELSALQILQKHPTGREYAPLLSGLSKFPVFIDSNNKILSMPPIINSNETGKITEKTKDVFIECSGFDLSALQKLLNIIVTTLADLGGKIYQMDLMYSKKITTPDLTPQKINLSLENTNKLLGLSLKESDLSKLLSRMGYDYNKGIALVPSWRSDILHEVDVIEDIAIAYGYENLIPEVPKVATIGSESKESKIKSKISEILLGLGLLETSSYHLITEDEAKLFKLKEKISLMDSKTEYKILRPNLLIPALRILAENKDNEYPQKIFELGTVFSKEEKQESGILESQNLLIASSPGNFTDMKQILSYLSKMLSANLELQEAQHTHLIEGRSASIMINKKHAGFLGEVHPETLRDFNIKMPVTVMEISLEEIFNLLK